MTRSGSQESWEPRAFIDESVNEIRARVGNARALCATSGGVDSTTAAVLVHKALGDNLICLFVNNGLMRKGECEYIVNVFREKFSIDLVYVDAEERFLERLKGVTDPEEKRIRIGNEFIRVFEEEAKKYDDVQFLVQGTVYPDVVESSTEGNDGTVRVKSHHNVGGLPEDMKFELIEPFRTLYKDQVRLIGEELGMPEEIVWRHPFPGPGLAVRILGEVTKERLDLLRDADKIVQEEIVKAGLYRDLWQVFAVLPGIRSVGVKGDRRTFYETVAIRAVKSTDGMRCTWAHLPYEVLESISTRIVNEVEGVNRVVYDITNKPPATIEWE